MTFQYLFEPVFSVSPVKAKIRDLTRDIGYKRNGSRPIELRLVHGYIA